MADFIDYVTLLLTNMTAALVVLAFFLWWGLCREDQGKWAPAFGVSGLVATIVGLVMCFTWPLPKPYNSAFGDMSVLFGVLFLGAAWALSRGWSLTPLGVYAFVPGLAAIVMFVAALTWVPATYMGYWMRMKVQPAQKSTSASTELKGLSLPEGSNIVENT